MTPNRYCENLAPTEPERALAGACLSALLTIGESGARDWTRKA